MAYFAALSTWRIADDMAAGASFAAAASHIVPILTLGLVPVTLAVLYAWFAARSTLYTITTKRVVMRSGVALPIVLNLPFSKIASAAVAAHSDGTGDIPLAPVPGPASGAGVSTLLLWPHLRPWRFVRPEPMLRALREPDRVARILADALAQAHAQVPVAFESLAKPVTPARAGPALINAVAT